MRRLSTLSSLVGIALITIALCCGCPIGQDISGGGDDLVIMTWNVQNLMDGVVDGTEYEEYLPKSGWNDTLYRSRLKNFVKVITDKALPLPHVLVLEELEHDRVAVDLLKLRLARLGFSWYAVTGEPHSAIQIGVMSRLPIKEARTYAVPGCRPVLECVIPTDAGTVVILAVHGKSRREGIPETEPDRIALSRTIGRIARDWRQTDPSALVLAVGDFNESPDAYVADNASWQTAFIEVSSPKYQDFSAQGSLAVSGSSRDVSDASGIWYSPWLDPSLRFSRPGSCWFAGGWHRYDQIVGGSALFDGVGWDFFDSGVGAVESLCSPEGTPLSWNVRTHGGISDHFPVWVRLRRVP